MSGNAIPARCCAAPSSFGAGIFDQSTSSRLGWLAETMGRASSSAFDAQMVAARQAKAKALVKAGSAQVSPLLPHQPRLLALPAALRGVLALVVQLLALCQRQPQLGAAAGIEVELERHHGHALALHRDRELVDLVLVQQQAAGAAGVVLEEGACLLVLRDVRVDEEDAAVLGAGVAFGDVGLARAQRLHVGAGELDAGLPGVLDTVLEARPSVLHHRLAAVVVLGRHGPRSLVRPPTRRPSPATGQCARAPRPRPSCWPP